MILTLNILLSLLLAIVVTLLVVLILTRQPAMRQGIAFYSPVIFILIAAVGLWSQGRGALGWLGAVVTGLIVLLTALAMRPRGPSLRLLTSENDSEPGRR
ncbi:MAG: hypothetical protein ACYC63_16230 [Armatimonadota bacterium]